LRTLNRKTIDRYLFFKISNVNLCVSILDFQSVINIDNSKNKVTIYKHKRYNIRDLAEILKIDVKEKSLYGITREKDVYLVYSILSVALPEKTIPFNQRITGRKLYKNYIFFKGNVYLQIDMERI